MIVIIDSEQQLKNIQVNLNEISKLNARYLIVTSSAYSTDFVSRFFALQSGINEDPVTGSAYTSLIATWTEKLEKND